ncbi:hypothetical protein P8452_55989 [Trifolium repens]|nr:hypothetical protein P8452_55989 [Trifolium repens]
MNHSNMENFSEATKNTISNIKRTRALSYTIESFTYHDNTSTGYEWLPPAWVAEERRGMTGRVYTYYYDPQGNRYKRQREVIAAMD